MDNATYAALLSLLVTVLTSLFKAVSFTTKQKNLIATVLSVVAGFGAIVAEGADFTLQSLAINAVAIYGASQIAYHYILSGTKLEGKLASTTLFGSKSQVVEEVVTAVSKEASKSKKTTKTPSTTKTSNKNRTKVD
jgi:hypothetical protein